MSQAEYFSKPLSVFNKLTDALRHFPALRSMLARAAALLRGIGSRGEPPRVNDFPLEAPAVTECPGITESALDEAAADPVEVVVEPPGTSAVAEVAVAQIAVAQIAVAKAARVECVVAEPEAGGQSEREKLIRRRWAETGIKMWNPEVHGAGRAALNIQGGLGLLPPKPGETAPQYDKLEFKLIRSDADGQAVEQILCERVVVDPPKRRARRLSA
jgi:hypothetical protein